MSSYDPECLWKANQKDNEDQHEVSDLPEYSNNDIHKRWDLWHQPQEVQTLKKHGQNKKAFNYPGVLSLIMVNMVKRCIYVADYDDEIN